MYAVESNSLGSYQTRIDAAQTWHDLEDVCSVLDSAFLTGQMTLSSLEVLCASLTQKARTLPTYHTLSAADLVEQIDQCDCCGSTAFRDNGGQVVCSVCHPDPHRTAQCRRAA